MSTNTIHAMVHLSGHRRGATEILRDGRVRLSRQEGVGLSVVGDDAEESTRSRNDIVAALSPLGDGYLLEAMPGHELWVNGARVTRRQLACGDVLEVGHNGGMLRYRTFEGGTIPRRSMSDLFADCRDGARFEHGPLTRKTGVLIGGITQEFLGRTTLAFRIVVVMSMAAIFAVTGALYQQNLVLEQRVAQGESETQGLVTLVREGESKAISGADLDRLRGELASGLSTAVERVAAVEQRVGATTRVVAQAARSVIFLQGAYGFVHEPTGRLLRHARAGSPGGALAVIAGGEAVTLDGDGPPVELQFTGTGYVASEDGLIVTNRHVAEPWRSSDLETVVKAFGLVPVMNRFAGFLPGQARSFEVVLAGVSESADVAILRCNNLAGAVAPLRASTVAPRPGDEVIVLGFPTGVRAMLARAGAGFVEELRASGDADFWTIGERLAKAGHIAPLATRGIIGQVSANAVVYDADTTHGGSGGPVLNVDGEVVAVNAAILRDFGGSNMGVPVGRAAALVRDVAGMRSAEALSQ
jgi:S1-C subfamily serine protease